MVGEYGPRPGREDSCVISDISVVLRETTLTISDSSDAGSLVKTEIWEWFLLVQRK